MLPVREPPPERVTPSRYQVIPPALVAGVNDLVTGVAAASVELPPALDGTAVGPARAARRTSISPKSTAARDNANLFDTSMTFLLDQDFHFLAQQPAIQYAKLPPKSRLNHYRRPPYCTAI
jgi:hypothetical protein